MSVRLNRNLPTDLNASKIETAEGNEVKASSKKVKGINNNAIEEQKITVNESDLKNKMNEVFGATGLASLSVDINTNKFPQGYSKYEVDGASLEIYSKNSNVKSQLLTPLGFKTEDFIKKYTSLYDVINNHKNISTRSLKNINNSHVNGLIDENVLQGNTGDCWLISSIHSINSSEKGKEIIKNAITQNSNGSVTVNFAGAGVSYTLSASEIRKYDTDNNTTDAYSNGDNDILALELATEKLWQDINSGEVRLNSTNEDINYTGLGNGIDDGGLPHQMLYYLTGIEAEEYYNNDLSNLSKDKVYSVLQGALNNDSTVIDAVIYYNNHNAKLTDGSEYSLNAGEGGHSLSITNVTEDTVTIVNPWDTSSSYTMNWEEFANFGIGFLSSADLNQPVSNNVNKVTEGTQNGRKKMNVYYDEETQRYIYRRNPQAAQ